MLVIHTKFLKKTYNLVKKRFSAAQHVLDPNPNGGADLLYGRRTEILAGKAEISWFIVYDVFVQKHGWMLKITIIEFTI